MMNLKSSRIVLKIFHFVLKMNKNNNKNKKTNLINDNVFDI